MDLFYKILIADDDKVSLRFLQLTLDKWECECVISENGKDAFEILKKDSDIQVVIVDWIMPEMNGITLCQKIRENFNDRYIYIIMLTAKGEKEDIVQGLASGADDYIIKPVDRAQLRQRLYVAKRILALEKKLSNQVEELEQAIKRIIKLEGLLPICSYCKKIRNGKNYWQEVEEYISQNSGAEFSHGYCPNCFEKYIKPGIEKYKNKQFL